MTTNTTDDIDDLEQAQRALAGEMHALLRMAKRMRLDVCSRLETAASLVEQAIDEVGLAHRDLDEEVTADELRAEYRHQRESAPVVL